MKLLVGPAAIDDLDGFLDACDTVADERGVTVQAFDADYVVGRGHLRRAVELASRARERGENVARDRGVGILCYAAGRRQIEDALTMGVSEGRGRVVVLVDDPDAGEADAEDGTPGAGTVPDRGPESETAAAADLRDLFGLDPVEEPRSHDPELVRSFFGISDDELAAAAAGLAPLVAERVALLDVEK